ncbi:MAG: HAD-IIIA family hydrolase [Bacteroidetes bacterium]|nr:HAD-IIIA family hydrolase [Bacteroidota bacterium]MBL6962259.1 HAD-IIIA family hydrolase [Bacteroidota bacterium]
MNYYKENINFLIESGQLNKSLLEYGNLTELDLLVYVAKQTNLPYSKLIDVNLKILQKCKEKKMEMLVLDVDGVLTDGGMFYTESGDEFKKFNAKDGLAIRKLTKSGFPVGIISSGFNQTIIQRRADLLGIQHVYLGTKEKLEILESWCRELSISVDAVAYIGDDINDEQLMKDVGFSVCPADAVLEIRQMADLVLSKKGGKACVREFIDHYLFSGDD